MAIELKGLNNVMKKLDNLSNIKTKDVVKGVADSMQEAIKDGASFSDGASYIGEVEVRDYGLSCYIDVGLSNDNAPWELWKPLWFQHWGFHDHGLNFSGQYYITSHKNWFEETVNSHAEKMEQELKQQLRKKVKGALK